jgi:hypothetical protein
VFRFYTPASRHNPHVVRDTVLAVTVIAPRYKISMPQPWITRYGPLGRAFRVPRVDSVVDSMVELSNRFATVSAHLAELNAVHSFSLILPVSR